MTSPMIRIFILLILAVGTSFSQNSAGEGLGSILDSEGSIKSGLNGSFNASGYDMQLDPETGKPFFRPVANPNSTTSTIEWGKLTSGVGVMGVANATNTIVRAILVIGADIYIGGQFRSIMNVRCNGIAKWDGSAWNPVGTGVEGYLYALEYDGTNIYAGGQFSSAGGVAALNVAKWNGTSWSAMGDGLNQYVEDLEVFQGNLYAGGWFTASGSTTIERIAVWNGTSWGTVGTNMSGNLMGKHVNALEATATTLYAGGSFTNIGGITAYSIAAWNGTTWTTMGSGFLNGTVRTILNVNGTIYAGGTISISGSTPLNNIAKWGGSAWLDLSGGVNNTVYSLATDGTNLYVGGDFGMAGGITTSRIAKWNGTSWSALSTTVYQTVFAVAYTASKLYTGGSNNETFGIYEGSTISFPNYSFDITNTNILIKSLCLIGGSLYVGGIFTSIDGVSLSNIAKWDGTNWHALGTGADAAVNALATDGTYLYAGGSFNSIGGVSSRLAKWDGSSWSTVGGQSVSSGGVNALLWRSGTLYAAGGFIYVGSTNVQRIAAFDGTNWSGMGSGFDASISALAHDGTTLYAGGGFTTSGGVTTRRVARWNGSTWAELGTGLDNSCYSLLFIGSDLYAAGYFATAGGIPAKNIAKWNGTAWSALGDGFNSYVYSLAEMNGDLYAGGAFTASGVNSMKYLAKWNGSSWTNIGANLDGAVWAILPSWHYQSFIVGGQFISFDLTSLSKRIAKFTDSDNPLPVELVSFSGALRNNAIQLNWQTATEVDNHGFEIEKKSTKSDWLKIGFVEGHGTSNSPKYYSFTDKSVLSGEKYQYRLKQIDGDGTFTYSNIIEIEASAITGFTLEQNYPNPFSAGSLSGNTETVIRFALPVAGDVRLDVYNSAGERIKTLVEGFREAGVYSVRYSAEGLASGIYFYNLEAGGSRLTGKMLLLR